MAPSAELKHYTIKFSCNYAITIPCIPDSKDVDQVYPIDKPCPQCLPHPYLRHAIFDQAHWDEVHALNRQQELRLSPRKSLGKSVSPGSDDRSDARFLGATSATSWTSSRGSMMDRLRTLKRVVRVKSNLREQVGGTTYADGEVASAISEGKTIQDPITTVEEEDKKKEIEKKIKEVEAEVALNKMKEIEIGLMGLFNDNRGKMGRL